jgi:NADH-quinone oxidoreductase subunit L
VRAPAGGALNRLWLSGWGFDWLYNNLFVRPYIWLAKTNKDDIVDAVYDGIAWLFRAFNRALSLTQNGRLRWYAAGIMLGAIVLIGMAVLL